MKNNPKLSYKLIVVLFVLLTVLIFGSVIIMRVILLGIQNTSGSTDVSYSRHYAFIHAEGEDGFWNNVYEGAQKRGEELGIYVEYFGDNLTADYSQNELLQIAVDANVDGIITDGSGDDNTSKLINKAFESGIPVVTVMDDCANSSRITFVGISSYTMGRQYGEELLKDIGEKNMTVNVMMDAEHNGGQELVISGISDLFSEHGLEDNINIEGIYIDSSSAFGAEEDIRDLFLNDELPDVMIALNSVYTRCLFQAAVDYNRVGDMKIYGFHDSDDILDAVSKNIIDATLSVNTTNLGSSSVEALEEYLTTGYVSEYISQDTNMIRVQEANEILLNENDEAE